MNCLIVVRGDKGGGKNIITYNIKSYPLIKLKHRRHLHSIMNMPTYYYSRCTPLYACVRIYIYTLVALAARHVLHIPAVRSGFQ
jgi:hypothetical protein